MQAQPRELLQLLESLLYLSWLASRQVLEGGNIICRVSLVHGMLLCLVIRCAIIMPNMTLALYALCAPVIAQLGCSSPSSANLT